MAPKRSSNATKNTNNSKKQRNTLSLEVKLKVLKRLEGGERQVDVCRALNLPESTVRTIIKNADKIKEVSRSTTPLAASKITRTRSTIMVDMERLLSIWIEEQIQRRIPLSTITIQSKALSLHTLLRKKLSADTVTDDFLASSGWFNNFKRRAQIHSVVVLGETASADTASAEAFIVTLAKIIEENGYKPQQIFNVDETGLFWKRMPRRSYIAVTERQFSGYKVSKDRLTLLLGGNASGDLKLKPLLIYHSENPRALKGYDKKFLPVIWKSNKKAWVTRDVFENWFTNHFCPEVKIYCSSNNIEHKILLIIDNAPGHPTTLNDVDEHVTVMFLPPNTTSILQPMDQGVIANLKAYYLRKTFVEAIKKTDGEHAPTLTQFWKDYNIRNALVNIDTSWNEVTTKAMNCAWRKLLPKLHQETPNNVITEDVVGEILCLGQKLGFAELEAEDINELLDSHQEPLTDEDLIALEQQRAFESDEINDESPPQPDFSAKKITEILNLQDAVFSSMTKYDPQLDRSSKIIRTVEQAFNCYRILLEEKKGAAKQTTLDSYFERIPSLEPLTTAQRPSYSSSNIDTLSSEDSD